MADSTHGPGSGPDETVVGEKLAQGDRVTLTLTAWGRLGEAMAEHQGWPIFVSGGIPGEMVVAEIVRLHRKYASARTIEVLDASAGRVEPPCQYYGDCSGCQWQHVDYQEQLATKRDRVVEALSRVGGFQNPRVAAVIPSKDQYGYRNHARFTVNREGALGFVNRETRRFVRIDHCMLMHQGINNLLQELQDRCGETTQLSIRAGKHSGDYLVQPALALPDIPVATGQKQYTESVNGRSFLVSSPSFFQVNVEQAAVAVAVIKEELALGPDDVLLDAYTGVGTFAILLASTVKRVIAVEESSAAVADAKQNAAGMENVEFTLGRTEDVLRGLPQPPDVVVLDPPRAGCQARALESLIEMAAPRVAYVSCDAETLSRDLKILCQGGYSLDRVVPLDMFPQTHHVECVAVLRWIGATSPLVLASASPRRREIMDALRLRYSRQASDVDEAPFDGESPQEMVERLSRDKAQAVAVGVDDGFVVGADSVVVFQGRAIGKPVDNDEARNMLRMLRGTTHHVITGLTVINAATGESRSGSMTSQITLRDFTDHEIEISIVTGIPRDKAGAYAIQDKLLNPASSWEGCYNNIVGLPVCRLVEMLTELGFQFPQGWSVPEAVACGPGCPSLPSPESNGTTQNGDQSGEAP